VMPGPELPVRVARVRREGTQAHLFFATHTNYTYFVERALVCTEPMSWSRISTVSGAETVAGTGHVVKFTVPVAPAGATQSYYRIGRIRKAFSH
jgi:hypothetical protein